MFGGWKRLSFKENDAFIDRARQFCAKKVAKDYKDEYKLSPMEVYSQVVNGKNYKVLLVGKHFKNGDLKCFSGVTYVAAGPKPQPVFQDNTFKAVDGKDCTLAADKKDKLAKAVADYFKGSPHAFSWRCTPCLSCLQASMALRVTTWHISHIWAVCSSDGCCCSIG